MGDDARGWLEDEIEEARKHAKLLDYLAATFERGGPNEKRRKGEIHVMDVVASCMYAAERCRQYADNLADTRAMYDARMLEPLDGA